MSPEIPDQAGPDRPGNTVYRNMLRGAGWGVLMRWGIRIIGIFNLMIIARLLTPVELGVVALATLLIGLLRQFYQIGIALLLIRKQEIDRADCDTAWTLRMAMGAFMAMLMAVFAPVGAEYFDEPRMVAITYVLAAAFFITSCANVGMVLARRELDFARDFRYNVYTRFFTFFVTIGLAVWLRNAWAIAFGTLLGAIIEVVLSFRMHHYRPRFNLSRYQEYFKFGLSIIPFNIGQYLVRKVDAWFVGGIAPTDRFVAYNMGSDLSATFTQEIVGTIGRGQFPNYSKILSQPEKLATAFSHELNAVCMLVLPLGVGLAMVSDDAVPVLLGAQWNLVIPLLPWLAIYNALAAIITLMTGQILIATGYERLSAGLTWVRLAIIVPIAYMASQTGDVEGVAMAMVLASGLAVPIATAALVWSRVISLGQILNAVWRPISAVLIMALIMHVLYMDSWDHAFMRLVFAVVSGALVYGVTLVLLWMLAGRPEGPESALIGIVLRRKPVPESE